MQTDLYSPGIWCCFVWLAGRGVKSWPFLHENIHDFFPWFRTVIKKMDLPSLNVVFEEVWALQADTLGNLLRPGSYQSASRPAGPAMYRMKSSSPIFGHSAACKKKKKIFYLNDRSCGAFKCALKVSLGALLGLTLAMGRVGWITAAATTSHMQCWQEEPLLTN